MTRPSRLSFAAFAAVAAYACTAPAPSPTPPPTPPPLTAEQSVDWYKQCWAHFNSKAWDAFQNCYKPDATSDSVDSGQPIASGRAAIIESKKANLLPSPDAGGDVQLIVASGNHLVSIALWKGTHTEPMPGPDGKSIPATGKKFGLLMAHAAELDAGRTAVESDSDYFDAGTYLAQLGLSKAPARKVIESGAAEPTVAIAKNDAEESSNQAAVQALFETLNKHDVAGLTAMLADSYRLYEGARPADANKQEAVASTKELFKAFPDVKLTPAQLFGAGPYVVAIGTFEGTNQGDMPSMGLKKTGKAVKSRFLEVFRLEGGKVVEDWLFYNSLAFMSQLGTP